MDLDALMLARLQFAFTIAWHIIFPSFSIGLASFLAVLEAAHLATKRPVFHTLYLFWVKIFAISFGMGVVSGVVMSYEFGTNWSVFAGKTGSVIGPLMAFEVLAAFFLEASFLGVMLFGWKRVGPKLHFFATCMVALGTLMSAFWIISANSWMQHPVSFEILPNGRFVAVDWLQVIFSPTFPTRLAHMVLAAFLSTALMVGAASAHRLLKDPNQPESRVALRMAIGMFAVVAPLQLFVGDMSGRIVGEVQPAKLAAIEGFWQTRTQQPFTVIGWPDRAAETNHYAVAIPKIGSLITHGSIDARIKGLKDFAPEDRPPVAIVFWAFRIMVGLGLAMIGLGFWGLWLWARQKIEANRWYLRAAMIMGPTGFVAVISGWVVAEVGRQPYVVYGVLRTRDAVSPVAAGAVSASLITFLIVYAIVFSVGVLYMLRLIAEGPVAGAAEPPPGVQRMPSSALAAAPNEPGGEDHGA